MRERGVLHVKIFSLMRSLYVHVFVVETLLDPEEADRDRGSRWLRWKRQM